MHSFVLPVNQPDYRCGGCGLSWERSGAKAISPMPFGPAELTADVDGWFTCCLGRRFRWFEDASSSPERGA